MKRGNIRTAKKYVTENGIKKIKYEIQGRRKGNWIPVVERIKGKPDIPMIYNTQEEADKNLIKIVKMAQGIHPIQLNKEK